MSSPIVITGHTYEDIGAGVWFCNETDTTLTLVDRDVWIANSRGFAARGHTAESAVLELVDAALCIARYHGAICQQCPVKEAT